MCRIKRLTRTELALAVCAIQHVSSVSLITASHRENRTMTRTSQTSQQRWTTPISLALTQRFAVIRNVRNFSFKERKIFCIPLMKLLAPIYWDFKIID